MYYSCIIIHLRYSTISPRHPRKTNITVPRLLTLLFAALSLSLSLIYFGVVSLNLSFYIVFLLPTRHSWLARIFLSAGTGTTFPCRKLPVPFYLQPQPKSFASWWVLASFSTSNLRSFNFLVSFSSFCFVIFILLLTLFMFLI